jgi:hypothetical protein
MLETVFARRQLMCYFDKLLIHKNPTNVRPVAFFTRPTLLPLAGPHSRLV